MELVTLTPKEFRDLTALIYERTGIHLPETKLTLLSNRLRRRLRALGLKSFGEYHTLIRDEAKCQEELPHFLSAVTTNETYFFRNTNLWEFFRNTWIPELVSKKKGGARSIRIWSAASSSGEEAYTAAICLLADLPDVKQWRISVVGTDISQRMLDRAQVAEYNDYAVSKTSKSMLVKWFDKRDGVYALKPEVRKLASFHIHNLRDPFPDARLDMVFLRNVLMYFDMPMKQRVLQNVARALAPGGYMIVGDVDPVRHTPELNQSVDLEYCGPNVYRKPLHSREPAAPVVAEI